MESKKNILIIGSYGSSNIGDEAILECLLKKLKDEEYTCSVLSGDPQETSSRHNVSSYLHFPFGVRSFFSFKWIQSFKILNKSDCVLIGGGGLFVDDYSLKAVFIWAWHALVVLLFKKKLVILANSVGPLNKNISKKICKWVFDRCDLITLRDSISFELVTSLTQNKNVYLTSDPAFLFEISESKKNIERRKNVAISLRDWDMEYSVFVEFVDYLRSMEYNVIFIPMDTYDEVIYKKIACDKMSLIVPKDYSSLCHILMTCEIVIGMRLHFLIAATLSGAKVGAISYSSKVTGLMERMKVPYVLPADINISSLKNLFAVSKQAGDLNKEIVLAQENYKFLIPVLNK